jgi:hypothetical protein
MLLPRKLIQYKTVALLVTLYGFETNIASAEEIV